LKHLLAAASLLLMAACSGGSTEPVSEPADDSGGVAWSQYAPQVRERIDRAAERGNCEKLQQQFDIAGDNDEAQRNRTGKGNGDLMAYIDKQLREAGCY
jgi:hypothetical protein